MTLIRFENVSLTYELKKRTIPLLVNFNLEIEEGSFLVLMGPSGLGKTTILNIMAGFLLPSQGKVYFRGVEMSKMSPKEKAAFRNGEIGLVHQFFNLLPCFTALQNVSIPLLIAGLKHNEALQKAEEFLEKVGILARANHYPSELSGGEQQRVAIARALVNQPKVIIADEPTGNLDQAATGEIMDLLCEIHGAEKATLVIATHDPLVAKRGTRVIDLREYLG
jgi:putative ABC transport system ATP-binding protein